MSMASPQTPRLAKATVRGAAIGRIANHVSRLRKAELDERASMSAVLKRARTMDMEGFTRPSELRMLQWFPGGRLAREYSAPYAPHPSAYEPHTVVLTETRYAIEHDEPGRKPSLEHDVHVCRAADVPDVLADFNNPSSRTLHRQQKSELSRARWPHHAQKAEQRAKWWDQASDSERAKVVQAGWSSADAALATKEDKQSLSTFHRFTDPSPLARAHYGSFATHAVHSPGLIPRTSHMLDLETRYAHGTTMNDRRLFHTSSASYTDVDPHFAQERAKHRSQGSQHPHSMDHIGRSQSLPEGATTIRDRNRHRIPREVLTFGEGGTIASREHASGYQVPHTSKSTHVYEDGTPHRFGHASATEHGAVHYDGKHIDALTPEEALKQAENALEEEPEVIPAFARIAPTDNTKGRRSFSTSATVSALPLDHNSTDEKPDVSRDADVLLKRPEIPSFQHLAHHPFYRPLLTVTFPTRQLAILFAQMLRGAQDGRPFHISISSKDRKDVLSFSSRMRHLRLLRAQHLVRAFTETLAGHRGGMIGARLAPDQPLYGHHGHSLEKPLPSSYRQLKVSVGNWQENASELKDWFRREAKRPSLRVGVGIDAIDPIELTDMDEHGYRLDNKGNRDPVLYSHLPVFEPRPYLAHLGKAILFWQINPALERSPFYRAAMVWAILSYKALVVPSGVDDVDVDYPEEEEGDNEQVENGLREHEDGTEEVKDVDESESTPNCFEEEADPASVPTFNSSTTPSSSSSTPYPLPSQKMYYSEDLSHLNFDNIHLTPDPPYHQKSPPSPEDEIQFPYFDPYLGRTTRDHTQLEQYRRRALLGEIGRLAAMTGSEVWGWEADSGFGGPGGDWAYLARSKVPKVTYSMKSLRGSVNQEKLKESL